jgi:hypothetical protein
MRLYPLWTKEELKTLKDYFPKLSLNSMVGPVTKATLLSLLPNKSWKAIKWKANQLDLKRDFKLVYFPLNLSDFDLGYIAGFFDGEGCISITRSKRKSGNINYNQYISIANTDLETLKWVTKTTNLGRVRRLEPPPPSERTEKWRQRPWMWSKCYTWQVSSLAECYRFITDIGPHLKIKKKLAELLLEFIEIQHKKSKPTAIRDHETGYFIRRVVAERMPREEEIRIEIRRLNKKGNSLNHV